MNIDQINPPPGMLEALRTKPLSITWSDSVDHGVDHQADHGVGRGDDHGVDRGDAHGVGHQDDHGVDIEDDHGPGRGATTAVRGRLETGSEDQEEPRQVSTPWEELAGAVEHHRPGQSPEEEGRLK